ncbi:hypothetical protein Tsubulata_043704, partial [Turnera subulata]
MAWFSGKVSLGNFPDLAGAVNKLSESVKNIEKNFDTALGFEEKPESSSSEASGLWPVMSFMGQKSDDSGSDSSGKSGSPERLSTAEEDKKQDSAAEKKKVDKESEAVNEEHDKENSGIKEKKDDATSVHPDANVEPEPESEKVPIEPPENIAQDTKTVDSVEIVQQKELSEGQTAENLESVEFTSGTIMVDHVDDSKPVNDESHNVVDVQESSDEKKEQTGETVEETSPLQIELSTDSQAEASGDNLAEASSDTQPEESTDSQAKALSDTGAEAATDASGLQPVSAKDAEITPESSSSLVLPPNDTSDAVSESSSHDNDTDVKVLGEDRQVTDGDMDTQELRLSSASNKSDSIDYAVELEKVKKEMKMMETALQGAARQAQAKADEIAKLMNDNEQLKSVIEDLKRKSSDAEVESLREEYHQKLATLERKVYALTKERDTLRREQNKRSDAAALLKEKDEIISQVMAEGEELSKKQAAQEATMRKLRAQIRELEEEKKGLMTKLQVEENKVESIKRDKAATEKLLQETIEKHQTELSAQKEFYSNALNAAKEAEALAEARANTEARTELESRLREAEERETMLVQALEELRQTLSRKEQQAVFREDMLRRDIEDLQKRYQASERRCEELVTQVPDSTRPLLRQIEAMQETTARRAEAWAAVERSLNSRLQEAETKAAAAEERERSVNERLSQTLSRINVLEAQISCLRAEQTQLSRSLEKERQRAAENR